MKKIKSFREYIEEQKNLELLKELNASDPLEDDDYYAGENGNDSKQDDSENGLPGTSEPEETQPKAKQDDNPPVGAATYTTNDPLRFVSKGAVERVKELRTKADIIRRTYDNLEKFIDAPDMQPAKGANQEAQAIFNLTQNKTYQTIKQEWLEKYKASIDKQRENQENVGHIEALERGTKSKLGYRLSSKNKKAELEKHRKALDPVYNRDKEEENKKPEGAKKFDSVNEEIINEFFRNPFATVGEYSSGIRNKFNKNKILDQTNKSGGIYNKKLEDTVIAKADKDFRNNARAIIAKQKGTGLSYLKRAEKNLANYLERRRFLKKTTDDEFISSISQDLQRAMNVLVYIGQDLQNSMREYNASLNKISRELETQDAKNIKRVTDSLNANTAISRYDDFSSKQDEKQTRAQDAKDEEDNRSEAQKQLDADEQQKQDEENKRLDNLKVNIERLAIQEFDNYIDAKKKDVLDYNRLLTKVKDYDLSGRRSKNNSLDSEQANWGRLLSSYLVFYLLKNKKIKKRAGVTGGGYEFDRNELITNVLDDIIEKVKNETPESFQKKFLTELRRLASDTKDIQRKEDEKLIKGRVSKNLSSSIKESLKSKNILKLAKALVKTLKDDKEEYYTKSEGNLTPEMVREAYAISNFILANILSNERLYSFVKKDPKTNVPKLVDILFDKVIEIEKKYDSIDSFNKASINLANSIKQKKATYAMTGGTSLAKYGANKLNNADSSDEQQTAEAPAGAKDFDGEQPKSIYAYAIQKAKKLQER